MDVSDGRAASFFQGKARFPAKKSVVSQFPIGGLGEAWHKKRGYLDEKKEPSESR